MERRALVAIKILHVIFALCYIACSSVLLHTERFNRIVVLRGATGLLAGIATFVFGVMMGRRHLIWILMPMIADAAMIIANVITFKDIGKMETSDWLSASLMIIGVSNLCLGFTELVSILLERRRNEIFLEEGENGQSCE